MQKVLPAFLVCIFFGSLSFAQEFKITGTVVDALSKEALEATTIYAESPKDSSLVAYTIADESGFFELEDQTNLEEIRLIFAFNGYKTLAMPITLKPELKMGVVQMEQQTQELKGVNVVGDRIPITIKKDTTEFNADSFKTRPDANVEDVLKKLPGVEVDKDGKITVNGKEVDKVLVNGQVFFSSDPKVATKSLPKEVIDKIQILDSKTKQQEFTGEEGDGENKTINLTIKKDKNKGYLGRLAAGYGTDDRYQANGLLNYFNNKERISVIAGSNNINNSGFSFDEIYDMVGNTRGGYDGARDAGLVNNFGNGITTSSDLGGSYANAKKGEYEVDANYFFGYSDSYNNRKTSRENILPDRRFFTDTESNFTGTTNSNRGAANLEYDMDRTVRISIEPALSMNRTRSTNLNNTISKDEAGDLINSSNRVSEDDGFQRNFSNRFNIIKKLDTLGGFVSFSFSNTNVENTNVGQQLSTRRIFSDNPTEENLDQRTNVDTKRNSYETEIQYRQPLGNGFLADFEYEYSHRRNDNEKEVLDFNTIRNDYTDFNETLSSDFRFRVDEQSPSIGLRKRGEKLDINLKATLRFSTLDNRDFLQNSAFTNTYQNWLLYGRLRYNFGKNKRFYARYRSNLDLPNVNQLQPIPNVNNPLNIVIGNPDLEPGVNHNLNFNYNNYDWKSRKGLYVYFGINIDKNQVSAVATTDENFLRTTRYTNVDGNYSGYAGMGYSKQIKKDSTFTLGFNFRPNLNFRQQVSYSNGVLLKAKRFNITPFLSTTFNYKELLEIEPEYGITFSDATYNLETVEDVRYVAQNANLRITTYWPKRLIWGNDIRYTYNGNVGPGFRKDALFWNMSLGWEVLKEKGTVKVLAYDLLDQNINTRRTTGEDFIQDFEGTVLQRYFMISFTYKFDQFGGKAPNKGGRRRYR